MIRQLRNWIGDEDGAVAPFLVLMLIPLMGMFAIGSEVTNWYMRERQLQNVADAAAIAAATAGANLNITNVNGIPAYKREAYGVAGRYGYQNYANADATVTPANVNCPGQTTGSPACFQVTVVEKVPLYLTQMVGYKGNAVRSDGRFATYVSATAIATGRIVYNYCLTGLGTNNPPVNGAQANVDLRGGGPNSDYSKCAAQSMASVNCTANTFPYIQAPDQHGNTCGSPFHTVSTSAITDPYASKNFSTLIANKLTSPSVVPCYAGSLSGTITAAVVKICAGNNTMTGPITIQAPAGATDPPVLIIYDTTLHTAGFSVSTTSGLGALGGTVIISGAGTTNMNQWFDGNGDVSIQGASGGDFDDMAIIVDPKLNPTQPFDPGNNSHVNLTALGTIYAPHTDILVGGSMSATIGSYKCVSIIAQSIYSNGGSLANDPLSCAALGFNLSVVVQTRQALVL